MRDNVQSDWNDSCFEAVGGAETVKEREGFAQRTGEFFFRHTSDHWVAFSDTLSVLNALEV